MRSTVWELILAPDEEPLTVAQLKRHLRMPVSTTTFDDDLLLLITAARQWAENITMRSCLTTKWRMTLGDHENIFRNVDSNTVSGAYYPARDLSRSDGSIVLLPSPVQSIDSFKTVNADGSLTTIDASTYELRKADSKWPELVPLSGGGWTTGEFRIELTTGWVDSENVPEGFRQAIKMHAEANFDRDKDMMDKLLHAARAALEPVSAAFGIA